MKKSNKLLKKVKAKLNSVATLDNSATERTQKEILEQLYSIREALAKDLKTAASGGSSGGDKKTLEELYQIRSELGEVVKQNQKTQVILKKQNYRIGHLKKNMMTLLEVNLYNM